MALFVRLWGVLAGMVLGVASAREGGQLSWLGAGMGLAATAPVALVLALIRMRVVEERAQARAEVTEFYRDPAGNWSDWSDTPEITNRRR